MANDFKITQWFGELEPKDLGDFYALRELAFIPLHFTQCATQKNKSEVLDWIYTNASGRYAIVKQAVPDPGAPHLNIFKTVVGFEDQNDALLFSLSFT